MTCIVGYIDKDYIYMGADSLGTKGQLKTIRKDDKLFKKENMLIGLTGTFRMFQLIKWKLEIPEHPKNMSTERYMCTLFIDSVIKCFKDNEFIEREDCRIYGGTFIVGYKNNLFKIGSDFQIGLENDSYTSVGSGEELALGAMDALMIYDKNIKPEEKIKIALKCAEKRNNCVHRPFKIMKMKVEK